MALSGPMMIELPAASILHHHDDDDDNFDDDDDDNYDYDLRILRLKDTFVFFSPKT